MTCWILVQVSNIITCSVFVVLKEKDTFISAVMALKITEPLFGDLHTVPIIVFVSFTWMHKSSHILLVFY